MRIEFKEIEDFINLSNKFRLTPVVAEEFPQIRDEFDNERIRLTQKLEQVKAYEVHRKEWDEKERQGYFGKF